MLEQILGRKKEAPDSAPARVLGALVSAVGGNLIDRLRAQAEALIEKAAALGVRAAAAAALFVAAVVLLLTGIKEGLVALGVPDWAASLGMAILAGLAGWLILRRKPAAEADDREAAPKAGLTVRIVREERRAGTEPAAEAPVIDVHPAPEGWEVSAPRLRRGPEKFRTKQEALRAARRAARGRRGGRIVVHRSDGSVQRARRRPPA